MSHCRQDRRRVKAKQALAPAGDALSARKRALPDSLRKGAADGEGLRPSNPGSESPRLLRPPYAWPLSTANRRTTKRYKQLFAAASAGRCPGSRDAGRLAASRGIGTTLDGRAEAQVCQAGYRLGVAVPRRSPVASSVLRPCVVPPVEIVVAQVSRSPGLISSPQRAQRASPASTSGVSPLRWPCCTEVPF